MDFDGLTGRVTFDKNGMRRQFNLGVYQVSLDFGPTKVLISSSLQYLLFYSFKILRYEFRYGDRYRVLETEIHKF